MSESAAPPLLSIIVPCYNEERTVEGILDRIRAAPVKDIEIIVVDDCSKDRTRELLSGPLRERFDVLLEHPVNRGKGAALRSGFAVARGRFVVVQDADLEYDPRDYPKLLQPLLEGRADVVFGSRFSGGDTRRVLYFWHSLGNRFLTLCCNMFSNLNMTDMETCYKVFRREIIQAMPLSEDRFGFEPEVTLKLARQKELRIYEVGISYQGRTYAEGKKIGWRDGVRALWCILKYGPLGRD